MHRAVHPRHGRSAPPRARTAPPARPAARNPGPCLRRRRSAPRACPARTARPRLHRHWCPCCRRNTRRHRWWRPTPRGAARRGIRAGRAAVRSSAGRWRGTAPARPSRWWRCACRGYAARRPASGACGAPARLPGPLPRPCGGAACPPLPHPDRVRPAPARACRPRAGCRSCPALRAGRCRRSPACGRSAPCPA
ncbi:hypothetical protein D3C72_1580790 [compost metagenome]